MKLLVFIAVLGFASATDWVRWGNDLNNTRWAQDEVKIHSRNVFDLTEKWRFEAFGEVSATPSIMGDDVYFTDWAGGIHRISLKTGESVFSLLLEDITGITDAQSRSCPLIFGNMIIIGLVYSGDLVALNRFTGELIWTSNLNPNVCARITTSPIEVGGFIYQGTSGESEIRQFCPEYRGSMTKVDPTDGSIVWQTWTIDDDLVMGPDSAIGASVWGRVPSFDLARNLVFVPTGQPHDLPEAVVQCELDRRPDEPSCLPEGLHSNSILALDLDTGDIVWRNRMIAFDNWNTACRGDNVNNTIQYCPYPEGPDSDFGQGPIVIDLDFRGEKFEWLGAGQKSGDYWMMDRETGDVIWKSSHGVGGYKGGFEFGSCFDGERIYGAQANSEFHPWRLKHSTVEMNQVITGSHFMALDVWTGETIWETPAPDQLFPSSAWGSLTVANGLVYASTTAYDGPMIILEAATGKILWEFDCGGSVGGGPSISDGTVLWGCGYPGIEPTPEDGFSNLLFAFHIPYLEEV